MIKSFLNITDTHIIIQRSIGATHDIALLSCKLCDDFLKRTTRMQRRNLAHQIGELVAKTLEDQHEKDDAQAPGTE